MTNEENKFEESLELLYWEFNTKIKNKNYSERDCFKQCVRNFISKNKYISYDEKEIGLKSPSMLIDEIFTNNQKLWFAQESIMNASENSKEALKAAKQAQELNAKRNRLLRSLDKVLGYEEISFTEKSYDKENK